MITGTQITAKDFEALCAELGPCELVRGEVVRLPPAGFEHGELTIEVGVVLSNWAKETGRGRVIGGEAGLVTETDPDTVRGVDVAYISYERLPKGQTPSGFCRTPPELAVEIVGKGQGWRTMVKKAGEYFEMGVLRVWIIDPKSRRVHILRPDDEPLVCAGDDVLTDEAVLPGFSCTVNEIFED